MAVIHNLIPNFIHDQFKDGHTSGTLQAVTLFMDISGSTALTQTMLVYGKRGAEILSTVLNRLFEPLIHAVYTHDGFITGFAGDAFTAVFPLHDDNVPLKALRAAEIIRQTTSSQSNLHTSLGSFLLEGRVGMSVGEVKWGIVGPGARLAYFFRGAAIEGCSRAEGKAKGGQVVVDEGLSTILQRKGVQTVPHGDGYSRLGESALGIDILAPLQSRNPIPQKPRQLVRIAARFFPPRLFEAPLPGEFRNAAIVFIHFENYLEFEVLNEFVSRTIWAADRFGGHFSEIDFGDKGGVLLFYFGAPIAHENDIRRALNFVLNLQERLSDEGLAHIKWRSGITFGPVYSGLTGTPYRGKYSLLGLTVNFAARLMDRAEWGQVLASEIVSQETEFLFLRIGDFEYRGFTQPVPTYRLLGVRPVMEKVFTLPMAGREAELQQLLDAAAPIFEGCFAGVAVVYGDPGMGKSRLTHALRRALPKRVTWMTAQNDPILRPPFSPFVYLLKQYFRQLPDDTHLSNQDAFDLQMKQLIDQLQDRARNGQITTGGTSLTFLGTTILQKKSFLGALIGLRWTDSLYEQLDGQSRFQNSLVAIKSLLLAESRLRPVVIELEDAHRLDEASQEMLNFLTHNINSCPIFILITTRYEEDGSLPPFKFAPDTPTLRIELKELPSDTIRRLAKDILDDSIDDHLLEVLLDKTRGNPYFAQQVLYYFQDNGLLQRLRHADKSLWGIRNLPHHDLPASIQAILTAQIDRLSPKLREVVLAASVLQREFSGQVLSHMLGKKIDAVAQEAEREQIWETIDGLHYSFRHELLRDAAYKIQMDTRLYELHQKAAQAFENLYPDTLPQYYAELVYHYNQAQDTEKERHYVKLAGDQAAARFANQEAIYYYSRALELTPETQIEIRYTLLIAREKVCQLLGERQSQANDLKALTKFVHLLGDPHKQAEVSLRWANYWELVNDYSAANLAVQQAIEFAKQKHPDGSIAADLVGKGHLIWGRSLTALSDYRGAQEHLKQALEIFQKVGDETGSAGALRYLGTTFYHQANYASALKYYRKALLIYRKTGNRQGEAHILNSLGNVAAAQGKPAEEKNYYELALSIRKEIGDRHGEASTLNNLGLTVRSLGDFALARDYFRQSLEIYFEVQDRFGETVVLHNLGEAFYYLKMYPEALASYRQSLFLGREIGDRDGEALTLKHLGNVLLDTRKLEQAGQHYQQALALHGELGQLQYEAEELAGLADVAYASENLPLALEYVREIMPILSRNPTLDGSEEPLRVYLTCHRVFEAAGDPQATQILQNAYQLVISRRDRILDSEIRQSFTENNPWLLEVLALWEKKSPKG